MGIESWSTTPGSNTSAPPDGAPEGMAPSAVNDTMRQQMADHRTQWNDAQWFQYGDGDGSATVSYVAGHQFKIEGVDVMAHYHAGRRVKVAGTTTGTVYGTITDVSFSTDTTVTVLLDSGSLQNEALTVFSSIVRADQDALPRAALSHRNLIINGAMTVDQRSADTRTGLGASSVFLTDRWKWTPSGSPSGRFTASTPAVTDGNVPAGKALRLTVTTADTSPSASELYQITQKIEAQNLQRLRYGTAQAETVTASVWVLTDKPGDYTLKLLCPDGGRTYAGTLTVTQSGTYERCTVTFVGDASGTINNDNGSGLELQITFGGGSNFTGGTTGAWTAENNNAYAAANSVNLFDDTNYFEFTGVQLEVGSVATEFEHEEIGTTLLKCQRYAYVPGGLAGTSANEYVGHGSGVSTTRAVVRVQFPVEMRGEPSLTATATDWQLNDTASQTDLTSIMVSSNGKQAISLNADVASGLTQFRPYFLKADGTANRKMIFSAEL